MVKLISSENGAEKGTITHVDGFSVRPKKDSELQSTGNMCVTCKSSSDNMCIYT